MKQLDPPDGFVTQVQRVAVRPWRPAQALAVVALSAMLGGCGGSDLPSVSGTVTVNGQPLSGGKLVFHPTGAGTNAYANIQSDGSYEARTGHQEGVAEGEYLITVHAPAAEASRIPPKYSDRAKTEQKITIVAGGNTLDIDVKP